jgi:3-hydroxyacyl-CoA dehydrogenase
MSLLGLVEAARELSAAERVRLADEVMATVDESDVNQAEVDAAWTAAIGTRVDDLFTGKVETIPFGEIDATMSAKIAAAHR